MSARLNIVSALSFAVAAAGLWWWGGGDEPVRPPARADTPEQAPRFEWPVGRRWRYRLEHQSDVRASLLQAAGAQAPARVAGRVRLVGEIELRSYRRGEDFRLGLRFISLETHELELLGEALLSTESAVAHEVLAHEAFLDVRPDGEVLALRFEAETPPVFVGLSQLVVAEMQVRLGRGASWRARETTQHGVVETTYARVPAAGGVGVRWRRDAYAELRSIARPERVAEQQLESSGRAVVIGGVLRSRHATERLQARDAEGRGLLDAQGSTTLELLETGRFDPGEGPADARLTLSYRPGQPAFDAERARRQHARQRVAGLSADELLNTLSEHAASGSLPDHNRFLWRATGLLREQPELCAQLVGLFKLAQMTHSGRALLLDLLVGAGTPAAQTALRQALSSEQARADPRFKRLYQRLSLVAAPTPETIALLEASYRRPGAEGARAATYALGSGAGHLYRGGERARGVAIAQRLLDDLEGLEEDAPPRQVVSLLGALGNVGLPAQVEAIARYRGHPSPDVRRSVAIALRQQADTPQARGALIELSQDADERVARRAVRTLSKGSPGPHELEILRDLVGRRALDPKIYPELVSLLAPLLADEGAVAVLRLMLRQDFDNPRLKGRIRALLGA